MKARRLIKWGGGALGAFLVVSLLVHLPPVQQLMGWTNADGTGACPFGHKPQVAAKSASDATPRAVLGFTLGTTTRDQVLAWAREREVTCTTKRGGSSIECADLPGEVFGAGLTETSAWFEVDASGVVQAIKSSRRTPDVARIASALTAIEQDLTKLSGASATTSVGSADELARGAFRQALREYKLSDFRAVVRATNMGNGYVLTESYAVF